MVFAVQGRGGDSIAQYDGSGGAASFGPRGEDTLGAGGAGGVEGGYYSPASVDPAYLSESPKNFSAGNFHWLFSKSPRVSSGSRAMMGCGAPAGGVGIPASAPSEIEVVQDKKDAPEPVPPKPEEKDPCEMVLNLFTRIIYSSDIPPFVVHQVVTTYQESGYFLRGAINWDGIRFQLTPATKDYGNYPFKEGHKLSWFYRKDQSPRDRTVCENSVLSPEANELVSKGAHEFLLQEADRFEKSRGELRAVDNWGNQQDELVALFADGRLAQELSQSIVIRTPNVSKDSIDYLRTLFHNVGIEEIFAPSPSSYAVYSHTRDHEEGKGPRFFVIRDNCFDGRKCPSLVHNYNEDLDFYYVGRNSTGPLSYSLTLSEEKVIEGHKFPKGTDIDYRDGRLSEAELGGKARIQGNLFQKGTELNFIDGKLDGALIFEDHVIQGKKFSCSNKGYVRFDKKGRAFYKPPLITGTNNTCPFRNWGSGK